MTTPDPTGHTPLPLTGERTVPGIPDENYWFQRHVVAYEHVRWLAAEQVVLDAGCGEGYGLERLSEAGASRVIGVDIDGPTVEHARATYASPNVEVHQAELLDLPLADAEVDLTVSFQVIEHLHDIPGYLASLRRVTRPGGTVVISTPNRLTFTPEGDTPVNPFHTREFTASELRAELEAAGLSVVAMHGVRHSEVFRFIERQAGHTVTDLLLASPPDQWPDWLRLVVHRATWRWFDVRPDDLDTSLDLILTAEARR